ncbi:hypothetical protein, partial [Streptomyces edwardsiae]
MAEVLDRCADDTVGVIDNGDAQSPLMRVLGVRQADDACADHDDVVAVVISHADSVVRITTTCQYKFGIFAWCL